jgi:hypothetical protein
MPGEQRALCVRFEAQISQCVSEELVRIRHEKG